MSGRRAPLALPLPPTVDGRPEPRGVAAWVEQHLGDLVGGSPVPGGGVRGGQQAADAALAAFDATGYAARRNEVWPPQRRGASGLSPWVRHGLLTLADLWEHVSGAPPDDRARFRDELLWQEYARHLYARLGSATGASLRFAVDERAGPGAAATGDAGLPSGRAGVPSGRAGVPSGRAGPGGMACLDLAGDELVGTGWVPNQVRMWMASWWVVHAGGGWRDGEDWLFARLLDGSRAANRLGWQWVAGAATGSPWVFGRHHVERRAPGLCERCDLRRHCPLDATVAPVERLPVAAVDPRLDAHRGGEPGGGDVTGPRRVQTVTGVGPSMVWLTAESLGDADPALAAHPHLPTTFVFDAPLLGRLQLSAARLVFLAETLADLATRREVRLWRGDPVETLAGERLAVTFAPVPGFARRAGALAPVEVHPWPWLVWPTGAPLRSYSAWRRAVDR